MGYVIRCQPTDSQPSVVQPVTRANSFTSVLHVRHKVYMHVGGSPTRIKLFLDLAFESLSNERPSQVLLQRTMPGTDCSLRW